MEAKGFDFAAIPQTAIKVLTSPSAFFREMPKTGGYIEPLIFMVVMGVIGGLIQTVFSFIGFSLVAGMAMGVASIVLMPIFIAIFGFIGAAIIFVIWKLMGSQEPYETAYRCAAYISALTPITAVLNIVPYLGPAAGIVLMTFLIVIASVEVHKIPSQKAWLVFGIIGAILILLNISAQFAARKIAHELPKMQKEMEEASKAIQKQTGEILKKSGEAQKAAEEMQKAMEKQAEETKKAMEEAQKQTGTKQ